MELESEHKPGKTVYFKVVYCFFVIVMLTHFGLRIFKQFKNRWYINSKSSVFSFSEITTVNFNVYYSRFFSLQI